MNSRIKSVAIMFLLLMFLFAGAVKGSDHIKTSPLYKENIGAHSRKVLGMDMIFDYDYAGHNVKHDPPPRGKKAGGGGTKNP